MFFLFLLLLVIVDQRKRMRRFRAVHCILALQGLVPKLIYPINRSVLICGLSLSLNRSTFQMRRPSGRLIIFRCLIHTRTTFISLVIHFWAFGHKGHIFHSEASHNRVHSLWKLLEKCMLR